ncbi:MAG TPA: cytochrome b N-terminal domain-containing protein [Candidatus Binatia bacterium]|nr:cytochrome b N-terminal domain-containing protein [Candidatus Binatia bacterium]
MPRADKNDASSTPSFFGPLADIVRGELDRPVATRVNPWRILGALAFFFFCVQIVTGLLLMVYYQPSADGAHYSMQIIVDEIRFGWLVRALHWWSSDLLLITAFLHLIRTYFARAYHAPAQVSWMSGVLVLVVLLAFGFTGTLLPWDQFAYWSVDSSRQTIAAIPWLGGLLLNLFWGGWDLGQEVLLRFYAVHVGILPVIAMVLLGAHLLAVWQTNINGPALSPTLSRAHPRVAADVLLTVLMVFMLTLGVLVSLATLYPPPLLGPADPLAPLAGVQPRWYLLPARPLLRSLSGTTAAVAVFMLFLLTLFVPFIDRGIDSSTRRVVRWLLGLATVAAWIFFAVRQYLS